MATIDEALDPALGVMTVVGHTGHSGHRMYIAGTSEVWQDSQVDHLEMLCHSDITWSLAL